MAKNFTRRFTPSMCEPHEWLVLVGENCDREHRLRMRVPDEDFVRRLYCIPQNVPVLIGRP